MFSFLVGQITSMVKLHRHWKEWSFGECSCKDTEQTSLWETWILTLILNLNLYCNNQSLTSFCSFYKSKWFISQHFIRKCSNMLYTCRKIAHRAFSVFQSILLNNLACPQAKWDNPFVIWITRETDTRQKNKETNRGEVKTNKKESRKTKRKIVCKTKENSIINCTRATTALQVYVVNNIHAQIYS